MKKDGKKNINIGLIELFNGTGENTVFQNIFYNRKGISISDLDMYSAWNTNGNAIGLGVAHCQVVSIAKETTKRPEEMIFAQTKMLGQHIIEDGLYTKSGKLALVNKGYKPTLQDRVNSKTLYELMDVNKVTKELSKGYTLNNENYIIENLNVTKLNFPWGRTFDIFVDFEGTVKH